MMESAVERNFRQTRNIWDGWAASSVQEIAIGGEVEFAALGRADDDGFGAGERGGAMG
jgi:hypothetical protein